MTELEPPAQHSGMLQTANALSKSDIIPEQFRNKPANCFIALDTARRMGASVLEVMQSMYVVHGSLGWKATYAIALANKRGPWMGQLMFDTEGSGKTLSVTCWAMHALTGEKISRTVDMKLAEAEKWTSNPKYKTMPEQMLCYRAATFLIRLYCPEVLLGLQTTEELDDMPAVDVDATVVDAAESLNAEVKAAQEPKPKKEPKKPAKKKGVEPGDDDPLTLAEFWDMCDCTNFAPGEAKGAVEDLRAMAKELGLDAKMMFDAFVVGEEKPERPDDE